MCGVEFFFFSQMENNNNNNCQLSIIVYLSKQIDQLPRELEKSRSWIRGIYCLPVHSGEGCLEEEEVRLECGLGRWKSEERRGVAGERLGKTQHELRAGLGIQSL